MKFYRHPNKRIVPRAGGRFAKFTADDFGTCVCPQCGGVASRPAMLESFQRGDIDPRAMRDWSESRACAQCGWRRATVIEENHRANLGKASDNWEDVENYIETSL